LCCNVQFLEQDIIISASSTGEVSVYKFDHKQQVSHAAAAAVEYSVLFGRDSQPRGISQRGNFRISLGWKVDLLADLAKIIPFIAWPGRNVCTLLLPYTVWYII